jgi:hypothetical protein
VDITLEIPLLPVTVVIQFERRQMRPFQWRFRLRTLMAIVAMVALALASWLGPRRIEYRMWARFHADQERQFLRMAANIERHRHSARTAGDVADSRAAAALHANEAERFQRGVFRPWEAITPDPSFADIHRGASYKAVEKQFRRFK